MYPIELIHSDIEGSFDDQFKLTQVLDNLFRLGVNFETKWIICKIYINSVS
jgi:hypothetical protein